MTVNTCRLRCACMVVAAAALLQGCGFSASQRSPEVLYSSEASSTRALQVPPDLTDVSDGEQFVLPGTSDGPVTRNTLLPQFQNARFVREGQASWLEIGASPESLWPELLGFLRREGVTVLRTQPINGLIETEWAPVVSDSGGSVLKNLLGAGDDSLHQRLAIRMERGTALTRLFIRLQLTDAETAQAKGANQLAWSSPEESQSADELEAASEILQRLLIHLGVAEQRAKGILGAASATSIFDAATLERTAGGPQLVLHRGYRQSFRSLSHSLLQLGLQIDSSDTGVGEIKATDPRGAGGKVYTFKLNPVHVSAVKVAVRNATGELLDPEQAEEILRQIRESLV